MLPISTASPHKWKSAKGPAAATLCTLLDCGWHLVAPDAWLTPGKDHYIKLGVMPFARTQVLSKIRATKTKQVWKDAGEHNDGAGSEEEEPHFEAARLAKKELINEGNLQAAASLDFVVAANHPKAEEARRSDGSFPNELLCHRCDRRVFNDTWHQCWD